MAAVLTAAVAAVGLQATAGAPTRQTPPGERRTLGQFVIDDIETTDVHVEPGQKPITFVLRGPKLKATSPRYDIAAPRIDAQLAGGIVRTANARGGARVDVRTLGEDGKTVVQSATLTSETANYTAASAESPARLDFPQRVRIVFRDPKVVSPSGPVDVVANSAYLLFQKDGSYDLRMNQGKATAEPLERATERTNRPGSGRKPTP